MNGSHHYQSTLTVMLPTLVHVRAAEDFDPKKGDSDAIT